jgi:sensor histidine kinase YesM
MKKQAAILLSMKIAANPSSAPLALRFTSWQKPVQFLLLNILGWTAFAAIGALTSLNDDLRAGFNPDYWEIFKVWGSSTFALAGLSLMVYLCFSRWPKTHSSVKHIALGYVLLLLISLPFQLLFVIRQFLSDDSQTLNWAQLSEHVLVMDKLSYLLSFTSVTGVYFGVLALKIWQQSQERRRAFEQERNNRLQLQLELEQQRLQALRAQLEPHFVFNALNAIGALVLSDNKTNALNGIHGLSDLLRYALTATEKNWVKIAEELAFLQDYLALQKLRYGARLHINMTGLDDSIQDGDCPPLLLQPLVENALRHDLDCHQEASDIHMHFAREGRHLHVCISNPLHADSAEHGGNPGTGIGLRNTRARLQLSYGDQANLTTAIIDQRFQVDLRFPLYQN